MTTNASELSAASPTAGDVGMVLAQLVQGVDAVLLVAHSVDELNLLATLTVTVVPVTELMLVTVMA